MFKTDLFYIRKNTNLYKKSKFILIISKNVHALS